MAVDWSRYGDCFTCGVDPGQPCVARGDRHSLLWPPPISSPHRGRALRSHRPKESPMPADLDLDALETP